MRSMAYTVRQTVYLIGYHGMGQAKPLTHSHENAMTGT